MVTTAVWHEEIGQLAQPSSTWVISFFCILPQPMDLCLFEFGMVKKWKDSLKKSKLLTKSFIWKENATLKNNFYNC